MRGARIEQACLLQVQDCNIDGEALKSPLMAELEADSPSPPTLEADLFPSPEVAPTGVSADAPAPALQAVLPSMMPKELIGHAEKLQRAMADAALLPQAFADFCAVAYVKPEWAGAASEFLADLFEGREEELADMARVPDLIIELATGHYALTFMAASVWAAKGDVARMSRLAEALAATQSKLSGVEVVDVMLALASSLAIARYPRAEQLLNIATPQAAPEHEEALAEARLWLAAGRTVRSCDQEIRDLWEQRLRRPQHPWTWESPLECAALARLADLMAPGMASAPLFQAVVPAAWWDLAMCRTSELMQLEAAMQEKSRDPAEEPPPPTEPPPMIIGRPIVIWRLVPFCFGAVVAIWAGFLGIHFGPFQIVRKQAEAVVEPLEPAEEAPQQSAKSGRVAAPSAPTRNDSAWRASEIQRLLMEKPALAATAEVFKSGGWEDHRAMLEGDTPTLAKDSAEYLNLLIWLHLSPPENEQINTRVPGLLADLKPDSETLDLWEKLVYPGSPNADHIRQAAQKQHHENEKSWSPSQRYRLSQIGWEKR